MKRKLAAVLIVANFLLVSGCARLAPTQGGKTPVVAQTQPSETSRPVGSFQAVRISDKGEYVVINTQTGTLWDCEEVSCHTVILEDNLIRPAPSVEREPK
jgi:hypothetical protein